jgi:hypothetical protein
LAEALRGMIKVQQFMHLRSRQTQRVYQEWDAFPNPRRAIGAYSTALIGSRVLAAYDDVDGPSAANNRPWSRK